METQATNKEKGNIKEPILQIAYKLLKDMMSDIVDGKCDPELVTETLVSLSPETKGYKRPEDYVTIDKGMKILGMGQNRVGFCNLMKKYHIINEKFNTIHIGYRRQKILSLLHKHQENIEQHRYYLENKK